MKANKCVSKVQERLTLGLGTDLDRSETKSQLQAAFGLQKGHTFNSTIDTLFIRMSISHQQIRLLVADAHKTVASAQRN